MTRNTAIAVFVPITCILAVLSAAAEPVKRTYLHRSRGENVRAVEMKVAQETDGGTRYTIDDFPAGDSGSKVAFLVDAQGKPVEYRSEANQSGGFEWKLADKDGVVLPNGKFKARHLVLLQQSSATTWYKKHRGSQTDIWVNDEGAILRIYRHREPYELVLQNYDKRDDLLSASETAQGYPQPVCKAP